MRRRNNQCPPVRVTPAGLAAIYDRLRGRTREAPFNRFLPVCKQASRLRRLDLQAGGRDVFRR